MILPPDLDAHWWWLIAALILGIAEMVIPGVFLIWLGLAALVTGLLTLLLGLPMAAQFLVFALAAFASVYAGRRWFQANPIESSDPLLNERTSRLVGRVVVATTAIENGVGRVSVGDSVWSCRGPDCAEGSKVRIVGADGSCLKVEPVADGAFLQRDLEEGRI
ncbi:MAG TPA: NfeD family protein [Allosphingosinicella sp.]|nr:NfeD family protein [Allosphingosinicella sp.]